MNKDKELKFLEALYLIQKTPLFDFGAISLDKGVRQRSGSKGEHKKMKYRKKPVVVEAIQYIGNGSELERWSNGVVIESPILEPTVENPSGEYIQIQTLEGCMIGNRGDYIIKGVNGEFYPCKPDIFEKTYELFEEIGQK